MLWVIHTLEVVVVAQAKYWLIGLAVVSLAALGVLSVLATSQAPEDDAQAAPSLGASAWGEEEPNFAPGDAAEEHGGGSGNQWGRFTVEEVCREEGVSLDLAAERLAAYELPTGADLRIRELADASGYKPSEIIDILLGEEPGASCDDPDCDCDHDSESQDGHDDHERDGESCDEDDCEEHSAGGET